MPSPDAGAYTEEIAALVAEIDQAAGGAQELRTRHAASVEPHGEVPGDARW